MLSSRHHTRYSNICFYECLAGGPGKISALFASLHLFATRIWTLQGTCEIWKAFNIIMISERLLSCSEKASLLMIGGASGLLFSPSGKSILPRFPLKILLKYSTIYRKNISFLINNTRKLVNAVSFSIETIISNKEFFHRRWGWKGKLSWNHGRRSEYMLQI